MNLDLIRRNKKDKPVKTTGRRIPPQPNLSEIIELTRSRLVPLGKKDTAVTPAPEISKMAKMV